MKVYVVEKTEQNGPYMYEDTDINTYVDEVFSTKGKAIEYMERYSKSDDADVTVTENLRRRHERLREYKWESPDFGEITYTLELHTREVR